MHRTTIAFSESLLRRAKLKAASEGLTVSEVLRKLLTRWIAGELRLEPEPSRETRVQMALESFGIWQDRDPDEFLAASRAGLPRRDEELSDARLDS